MMVSANHITGKTSLKYFGKIQLKFKFIHITGKMNCIDHRLDMALNALKIKYCLTSINICGEILWIIISF